MKTTHENREFIILIANSKKNELTIFEEALKLTEQNPNYTILYTDIDLVTFLNLQNQKREPKLPNMILFYINSEHNSEYDAIISLKKHKDFRTLPIILLITKNTIQKVDNAYLNGANACIPFYNSGNESINYLSKIFKFWFKIAKLPEMKKVTL